jgi:putative protein-disulfide isomerase
VDETTPDAPNRNRRPATRRATVAARTALTYVFDAHCPWSHAVTPTIRAVASRRPDLDIDAMHGRMLAHPAPLGAIGWYAPTTRSVRGLTGATFGSRFDAGLADGSIVADSDTAAAAFVAMRSIAPDLALDVAAAMHAALFVNGSQLTDIDTVLAIAAELGLSSDHVRAMLGNPLVGRLAGVEQARVTATRVTGHPALLVHVACPTPERHDVLVATRLRTADEVIGAIDAAIERSLDPDV